MTISTRVSGTTGVVSTDNSSGFTVERSTSNKGFSPFQVDSVKAFVSTSAAGNSPVIDAGDAGLCTLSGSGNVLTAVLPLASAAPGASFLFRSVDARAHVVTSSAEVTGSRVIVGSYPSGSTATLVIAKGAKITFDGVVGSSFRLQSDGVSWLVSPGSGSYTIA